jgi:hypothetical protein
LIRPIKGSMMEDLDVAAVLAHLVYLLSSADAEGEQQKRENLHVPLAEALLREVAADASCVHVGVLAKTLNSLALEEPKADVQDLARLQVCVQDAIAARDLDDAAALKQLVKFRSALDKMGLPKASAQTEHELQILLQERGAALGGEAAKAGSGARKLVVARIGAGSRAKRVGKAKAADEEEEEDDDE